MWLRRDVLAPIARLAGGRGLGPAAPDALGPAGGGRPHRLEPSEPGLGQHPGQKGGDAVGPNPTDRGKPGTKRHVVVERAGLPLATLLTGANRHDSVVFEALIDAIPVDEDARRAAAQAAGQAPCRQGLRLSHAAGQRLAASPTSACASPARASTPAERLGRHRWVVERTLAWLNRYRRLTVRYERRADIHHAFLTLGCAPHLLQHPPEGVLKGALKSPLFHAFGQNSASRRSATVDDSAVLLFPR